MNGIPTFEELRNRYFGEGVDALKAKEGRLPNSTEATEIRRDADRKAEKEIGRLLTERAGK